MSEDVKSEETISEVEINETEETLEEQDAKTTVKAKGNAKDETPVSEPESIASVDKATKDSPDNSAKNKASIAPKTKAGMISAMTELMLKMPKSQMQDMYSSYHGSKMDESVEETDNFIADESVEKVDAVDTAKAELDNLVESEATLSEEFKEKTAVIFEAAIKSKLSDEIDRLESQYKEELAEEVSSTKSELVEKVDSYLNYVVENWIKENELQIENGLRTEIAEDFMTKLKDLFTESYIEVPESKVDLVDELAEQVEELESKLNETTQTVIDQSGELEELKKDSIIRESASDLADTQVEKLKTLVNDLDFENEEKFKEKVNTIKEAHFSAEQGVSDESIVEEEGSDEVIETAPSMDRYVDALRKTQPKN